MKHASSRVRNASIIAAVRSGESHADLAERHGLSVGYVYNLVRSKGGISPKARETARRRAVVGELHSLGMTCGAVIRLTGLNRQTLYHDCKALGIKLAYDRTGWAPVISASKARAAKMAAMYRAGMTLQQIGEHYSLSRERVRQLMTKHHGVRYDGGGRHVKAVARRQQSSADKNARYLRKYGCTFEQYVEAREVGEAMIAQGAGAYQAPLRAFATQRNNAKARDISWELTFWQWWTIWQESGKWDERGRARDAYVMSRFGDAGAYAAGNIYIGTLSENSSIQPNNPYRKGHPDHARVMAETGRPSRAQRGCSIEGCNKPHYGHSYCNNHYYHFVTKARATSERAAA